jgi:hypothetical protein
MTINEFVVMRFTRCPECGLMLDFGIPVDVPTKESVAAMLSGECGDCLCWACWSVARGIKIDEAIVHASRV